LGNKEYGINTIKIWAQWRWNNPEEDVYDFGDIDQLMDIAAQNGIAVIINAMHITQDQFI
jgi:beta-galactosidase GanA